MNRRSVIAVMSLLVTNGVMAANASDSSMPVNIQWSLETGIGYETNAYHAPDHSYADYYADPTGATIVTPTEKSGIFIPLKFKSEISTPLGKHIDFIGAYRFAGNFHPDSALQDANDTKHKVSAGAEYLLGREGKSGKVYAGVFYRSQDKTYVDRDSGDPKASAGGVDVSNRYTYTSTGIDGKYSQKLTRDDKLTLQATYENLDYNDPVAWSQYDHIYTMYGLSWERRLMKDTKLTLGTTHEVRDYSARHAYDINGTLLASNPLLIYTYEGYSLGAHHRFSDETILYFDYEVLQRRDNNVGYNDMDKTTFKLRLIHDLNKKMRLRAKVASINNDYIRAYNFEDPTQGRKSASGLNVQLRGDYQWNKNKIYYVELERKSRDNTDERYQYNNNAVMLGAKWEY